jgi:hypothetical protein
MRSCCQARRPWIQRLRGLPVRIITGLLLCHRRHKRLRPASWSKCHPTVKVHEQLLQTLDVLGICRSSKVVKHLVLHRYSATKRQTPMFGGYHPCSRVIREHSRSPFLQFSYPLPLSLALALPYVTKRTSVLRHTWHLVHS